MKELVPPENTFVSAYQPMRNDETGLPQYYNYKFFENEGTCVQFCRRSAWHELSKPYEKEWDKVLASWKLVEGFWVPLIYELAETIQIDPKGPA